MVLRTSSADADDSRLGRPLLVDASILSYEAVVWDLGIFLDAEIRQYVYSANAFSAEIAQPLAYISYVLYMCVRCGEIRQLNRS